MVARNHAQDNINLTYIGTGTGDGGDQYVGLDRFGRVVDQKWVNASGTAVDEYQYGYDRDGNVLYKNNALSSGNSELYAYDGLNRLTTMSRSTLNGTETALAGSATRSQSWNLDALGNSTTVTSDGTAQSRTTNLQNQLTTMGGSTLTYDANGNETTDDTGKTLIYDAWNRLVEAKSGSTSLIRYGFDALSHRDKEGSTSIYFSANRQEIEDRNSSGQVTVQYVYSPVYIDAMIERDRDTNGDGTTDERLYVTQDANYDVTAIATTSGTIAERFQYDAYGTRTVLSSGWAGTNDGYGFLLGHQGGKIDAATNYVFFRNRELNTSQMRWMQEDPLGYVDSRNLFQPYLFNPQRHTDPFGASLSVPIAVAEAAAALAAAGNNAAQIASKLQDEFGAAMDLAWDDIASNAILGNEAQQIEDEVAQSGPELLQKIKDAAQNLLKQIPSDQFKKLGEYVRSITSGTNCPGKLPDGVDASNAQKYLETLKAAANLAKNGLQNPIVQARIAELEKAIANSSKH